MEKNTDQIKAEPKSGDITNLDVEESLEKDAENPESNVSSSDHKRALIGAQSTKNDDIFENQWNYALIRGSR